MLKRIAGICFLIITCYLFLYFLLTYNSEIIYTFSLNSDEFTLKDGMFIKNRKYNLLQLGVLKSNKDNEQIYRIELYVGDEFIVNTSSELIGNYLIKEKVGYNEYFNRTKLNNFKNDFKIKIFVPNEKDINCFVDEQNCSVRIYNLDVVEEFRNNNLI